MQSMFRVIVCGSCKAQSLQVFAYMTTAELDVAKQPVKSTDENHKKFPSKIGREGAGTVGQNWTESPEVAQKGRYASENKIQGDDPEYLVDTDVSEAV